VTDAAVVMQGTLDLLILKALSLAPMHGWGITNRIKQLSRESFRVGQGSLYPALHRLEKQSWIKSEWDLSDNKQRAKFYRLTPAGKKHLVQEQSRWTQFVDAMAAIMKPRDSEA